MSNQAGKGDKPRPLSVDRDTFAANWERAFGKKKVKETESPDPDYVKLLNSGMFFEIYPDLTGHWNDDAEMWKTLHPVKDICEYSGLPTASSYEDVYDRL